MNILEALEAKIASLIEVLKELKAENSRLIKENGQLIAKFETMEAAVRANDQRVEEEKALTKVVVDDLIKNIDSLMHEESQ